MTSGNFERVFISSIFINRSERQRRELRGLDELAASITQMGLIHPPVITRDFQLIAGERRLEACRLLGWLEIPIQYADTMSAHDLQLLELEENVKRLDLTWQEHNDAMALYHKLRTQTKPDLSIAEVSKELGVSPAALGQHLLVAQARVKNVEGVADAPLFSTARGIVSRNTERAKAQVIRDLPAPKVFEKSALENAVPVLQPAFVPPPKRVELLNASFLDWVKDPPRRFNLIHCDFPYGVGVGDKVGQSAAKETGTYADTPEIYFELLSAFCLNTERFVEPSAHLLFWFSMNFFAQTKLALKEAGWDVQTFPLIWVKSDNVGMLPDKDRGPRRIYETAFLASRGDRKVVRPVSNAISAGTTRELHTSEKPLVVLEHFFRMLVDDSTTLLDPTAGSGNALVAARNRGAEYSLGIELSPTFCQNAKEHIGL